jgi:hypothetical protein
MCFMDNRALMFLGQWKEATHSSQVIHQFRTHTVEEDASFTRTLQRQCISQRWLSRLRACRERLVKG